MGFYYYDSRDTIAIRILARVWQFCLLLLGSIGFCWFTFVIGATNIKTLYVDLISPNSSSLTTFIDVGFVLGNFIVPIIQVCSLIVGVYDVTKQLNQQVNADVASRLLLKCKRDALIFFIVMALLVITIDPIGFTHKSYESYVSQFDDDFLTKTGQQTYSLYVFSRFSILFLNLSVSAYLTVVMMFISLTFKQVTFIQESLMLDSDKLSCNQYLEAKMLILQLKNASYYSTQFLTFTALVNIVAFMFFLWFNHKIFISSYPDMILYDVLLLPLLFKGIIF